MGTSTRLKIPYPEPGDVTATYPAKAKDAADTIDATGAPYRSAAGAVAVTAVANGGVSVVVTFPAGRFTVPPVVTVGAISNGYGAGGASTPTASSVTVRYYNPTGSVPTGAAVHWHAVQMTSTTAGG